MSTKISIIGAGSAVFSLNLIRDLCLTPNLRSSTISLMDIDPQRLEAAYSLCQRYADEVGADLDLHKSTDRREALDGAGFVINSALVAGHQRLRAGWAAARERGYRHGGSLHVMHDEAFWINFYQLRLFEAVIEDLLEICPDAWYVQVANPVFAGITYLGRKYPQAKIVGLCHGFGGVYKLADALGLERERLTFEIPGCNHFVWLTRLHSGGTDALPLLRDWAEHASEQYFTTCGDNSHQGPKAVDLYRRFGAFPIGDTCTAGGGSWGWWYHVDEASEARWQEDPAGWWNWYFARCEQSVADIRRIAADTPARVTEHFPPVMSNELIVPLVESIACDIPRVLICSILNAGEYLPGVPRDLAVEVPTLVGARGIQGIGTSSLPPLVLAYLLRDRVAPVEVELQAYRAGDRLLLRELIMTDPWTRSADQAGALLDAILALPGHVEMRAHYQ
jgi:alpha-galactosidase/6-phospho-beta-glucosidase family protein